MSDFLDSLRSNFEQFGPTSALDVIIISLLFFWLLMLLRGTTAMSVNGVFRPSRSPVRPSIPSVAAPSPLGR